MKNINLSNFQDGHEICFVGDEAFRELSKPDPEGDRLLSEVCIFSSHASLFTSII